MGSQLEFENWRDEEVGKSANRQTLHMDILGTLTILFSKFLEKGRNK